MSDDRLGEIKRRNRYAEVNDPDKAWLIAEVARCRALISWIDGACVDEADHMVIREAINRWREDVNR